MTGGRRAWLFAGVAALLLVQMALAMVTTARQQSPTIDEPIYVGSGLSYVKQQDLRRNAEHPPLAKLLIGLGVAAAHPRFDPVAADNDDTAGRRLLYRSGNDAWRLMLLARLPIIALTLLFGLVVLAFATELTGSVGGLVALGLYAFSPDLIAHGSLATLDVPAAGFLLTSTWLLWRARRRLLPWLPLGGVALGAALATRMSTLPAVPVLLGLAAMSVLVSRRAARGRPPGSEVSTDRPAADDGGERPSPSSIDQSHRWPPLRELAIGAVAAAGVGVIAVAVVWLSYLAVDPRLRWTSPADVPHYGGLHGLLVEVMPFPRPFRDGLRIQFGLEHFAWGGFLFGHAYNGSVWYYLPAALLVKTPIGMIVLWVAGTLALATRRLRPAAAYLLVVPAVLFAVAMTGVRDFGVRYVIFMPVFGAVVAAAVTTVRHRWAVPATLAMLLAVAASSLRTFPYYLPYSNEAFGGTAKTYTRLHDSNSDWGQDLGRLGDRLRQRYPGQKVWLIYKGSGRPAWYGIVSSNPRKVPADRVRGLLVVSDSSIDRADRQLRDLIDTAEPIDQVGHTITIFRR